MGRWEKGKAPGPGRPPGSRNKTTVWLDELASQGMERLIAVLREAAENGDMRAMALLLARTWPAPVCRGRPVALELPAIERPADLIKAQAALMEGMARGEMTPEEAAAVATVLENQRRAIETNDHEHRLKTLEADRASKGRAGGSVPPIYELP